MVLLQKQPYGKLSQEGSVHSGWVQHILNIFANIPKDGSFCFLVNEKKTLGMELEKIPGRETWCLWEGWDVMKQDATSRRKGSKSWKEVGTTRVHSDDSE